MIPVEITTPQFENHSSNWHPVDNTNQGRHLLRAWGLLSPKRVFCLILQRLHEETEVQRCYQLSVAQLTRGKSGSEPSFYFCPLRSTAIPANPQSP